MSQRALSSVILLFCLFASAGFAKVPTLNPEQTVNPATGEMGFSLPLGSIPGYNANLGNKAGIQALDQPSPAGLGFGYEPGSITRKVVFVPDDNLGTRRNYTEDLTDDHCDLGWFT